MDWKRLQELRKLYQRNEALSADYWNSVGLLSDYHETLGERIRWKWQAVLELLEKESLFDKSVSLNHLVDWGCGTGIAARSFVDHLSPTLEKITLLDRSAIARTFAKDQFNINDQQRIHTTANIPAEEIGEKTVLLFSHVLNELDERGWKHAGTLAGRAGYIVAVEPGTKAGSDSILKLRRSLADTHNFLAPCTHQESCGLDSSPSGSDWCHFHASAPNHIHHDPFWSEVREQLQIDISSIPVSFLTAAHRSLGRPRSEEGALNCRILGRPSSLKYGSRFCACSQAGVRTVTLRAKKSQQKELLGFCKKVELPPSP